MRSAPSRSHVVCGAVGGGVFGAVISVVVNNALIEISLTPFFATVFGVVLVLLGGLMIYRKLVDEPADMLSHRIILGFSFLVLASGVSEGYVDELMKRAAEAADSAAAASSDASTLEW